MQRQAESGGMKERVITQTSGEQVDSILGPALMGSPESTVPHLSRLIIAIKTDFLIAAKKNQRINKQQSNNTFIEYVETC